MKLLCEFTTDRFLRAHLHFILQRNVCCTVRTECEGHCGQVYLSKGPDNYCRKEATAYPVEQNLCSFIVERKIRQNLRQRGLLFLEGFIRFTF